MIYPTVSGYISCTLMIIGFVEVMNIASAQDRMDSQVLDPIVMDVKAKRPFCNAFTGCGRKRSIPSVDQNLNTADDDNMRLVRLPSSFYRALLRAASQEMNRQVERLHSKDDYILQDIPIQEYDVLAHKITPAHDQYES